MEACMNSHPQVYDELMRLLHPEQLSIDEAAFLDQVWAELKCIYGNELVHRVRYRSHTSIQPNVFDSVVAFRCRLIQSAKACLYRSPHCTRQKILTH